MTTPLDPKLYNDLQQVIAGGNEEAIKKFVMDHITEFPEDVQGKLMLGFFEEGLNKANDDKKLVNDFQNDCLKTIRELEVMKLEKALE